MSARYHSQQKQGILLALQTYRPKEEPKTEKKRNPPQQTTSTVCRPRQVALAWQRTAAVDEEMNFEPQKKHTRKRQRKPSQDRASAILEILVRISGIGPGSAVPYGAGRCWCRRWTARGCRPSPTTGRAGTCCRWSPAAPAPACTGPTWCRIRSSNGRLFHFST